MKITGSGRLETTPVRRKTVTRATGDGAFTLSHAEEAAAGAATTGAAAGGAVAGITNLLALQEVDDKAAGGRGQALIRAEEMLGLLDDIRHGLLLGALPSPKLRRLLALTNVRRDGFIDPKLGLILSDIELRAKVELAKIEMSQMVN